MRVEPGDYKYQNSPRDCSISGDGIKIQNHVISLILVSLSCFILHIYNFAF